VAGPSHGWSWVLDPDLAGEASAKAEHAVAEPLTLVVVHLLMVQLVLEGGEAPECGASPLGAEDAHGENVFTGPLWVVGVVGAGAGFLAVVDTVDALSGAARHEVDIWGYALYVSPVVAVELEGASLAGGWVRGCASERVAVWRYPGGVHSEPPSSVGRVRAGTSRAGPFLCLNLKSSTGLTISKYLGMIILMVAVKQDMNGGGMAELLEDIGHNVRRLREGKGWNQTELGFHADMSPSIISLIENGKRNPSTATLAKIASALGVEVVDLFPKVSAPREPSLFNGLEEERRAAAMSWVDYIRHVAGRIQAHVEDPDSPAFRDPQTAFFFVEEANHNAADLGRLVDEQASVALEVADVETMQDLFNAFDALGFAIGAASARARLLKAATPEDETARKRAEKAAAEREAVERELSARLGHSA
jgi:transcriptional regulator with XRE-family HTH domain